MERGDLDLVRGFFEAYNARDVQTVEEMLDPEAEITTLSARKGLAARWESRATTRRYFEQLDESWSELQIEVRDVREVGGGIVAIGQIRGIGKASHIEVVEPFASVLVLRGSRFALIDTYSDPQEALAAARALPAAERSPGVA